MTGNLVRTALFAAIAMMAPPLRAEIPFTIVVSDPPGEGFNDPTPAEPVGGNTGKTVGAQRLIALQYAASLWSSKLSSTVPVRINASFDRLTCEEDYSQIASAGPTSRHLLPGLGSEVPPNLSHPVALANKLLARVLDPDLEEIVTSVNSELGKPGCLSGGRLYLGLDHRASDTEFDFVTVMLHELAHGLGFHPYRTSDPDDDSVFTQYVLDTSTGKTWNEMSRSEISQSAVNFRRVVWNGINVRKAVPKVLEPGVPVLNVTGLSSGARDHHVTEAEFGPRLTPTGIGSRMVLALDAANAAGPSTTDACSPLVNAQEVAGRIALVDRGTCPFVQKAANVQAAGAVAVVFMNNGGADFTPGGDDPGIKIPAVLITKPDGEFLKQALADFATLNGNLLVDSTVRRGADRQGRPFLFTPSQFIDGATAIHWDPMASPDQLMEPGFTLDQTHNVEPPYDLTLSLFKDIGWFADFDGVPDGVDDCLESDPSPTVKIQSCDTGVANTTSSTGCRVSDLYKMCSTSSQPGQYLPCVDYVTQELSRLGALGPGDGVKIEACARQTAK